MIIEEKHDNEKIIILVIYSFFGCFGALLGPLDGPLGASVIYVFKFHTLLLNIFQTRPIPSFYINPKRKYKKNKVKKHEFGPFLVVARTP